MFALNFWHIISYNTREDLNLFIINSDRWNLIVNTVFFLFLSLIAISIKD